MRGACYHGCPRGSDTLREIRHILLRLPLDPLQHLKLSVGRVYRFLRAGSCDSHLGSRFVAPLRSFRLLGCSSSRSGSFLLLQRSCTRRFPASESAVSRRAQSARLQFRGILRPIRSLDFPGRSPVRIPLIHICELSVASEAAS